MRSGSPSAKLTGIGVIHQITGAVSMMILAVAEEISDPGISLNLTIQ